MSIPVTASTETFTPACMAEIEGAPTFTFRHATVLDNHLYPGLVIEAGLRHHSKEDVREAVIEQLRTEFESDGMERNITRLTAFWAAQDEHASALGEHEKIVAEIVKQHEGDAEPELPPAPELDFPKDEAAALGELVGQVYEESVRVRKMLAQNYRHSTLMPRLLLRMFLVGTSLPVKLKKAEGALTAESIEKVYLEVQKWAEQNGVSAEQAIAELEVKAFMSYRLTEDEEKNSSSPLSGSSPPEQSASTQSSGLPVEAPSSSSSDPATSGEDNGSASSDSDSPASE